MATVEKYAAIPIDKYLKLVEQTKAHSSKQVVTPAPVTYQTGGGDTGHNPPDQALKSSVKTSGGKQSKHLSQPPPGLPAGDRELSDDYNLADGENWLEVWQELN